MPRTFSANKAVIGLTTRGISTKNVDPDAVTRDISTNNVDIDPIKDDISTKNVVTDAITQVFQQTMSLLAR